MTHLFLRCYQNIYICKGNNVITFAMVGTDQNNLYEAPLLYLPFVAVAGYLVSNLYTHLQHASWLSRYLILVFSHAGRVVME